MDLALRKSESRKSELLNGSSLQRGRIFFLVLLAERRRNDNPSYRTRFSVRNAVDFAMVTAHIPPELKPRLAAFAVKEPTETVAT